MQAAWEELQRAFDRIFVVTLERATDRQARVRERLAGLDFQFHLGVDKRALDAERLRAEGYDAAAARRVARRSRAMTPGEIGCALSHRQLYEALDQFARKAGFPPATYHLKRFRLKDSSFLKLFADPLTTKPPLIESLLAAYPQRRFVLVGDSGEQDPEVYGLIARRFSAQVAKIYIRDVTNEPATSERYRQAFAQVPTDVWQIFTDPSVLELP